MTAFINYLNGRTSMGKELINFFYKLCWFFLNYFVFKKNCSIGSFKLFFLNQGLGARVMVFNATFNNISVISWQFLNQFYNIMK